MSEIDKLVAAILTHAVTGPMPTIKDILEKYDAILRELGKPRPAELKDDDATMAERSSFGATMQHLTMAQYLVSTMKGRGKMSNPSIYREVEKLCNERGRELPVNWKAEIRETLQAHCASRPQWNRRDDFFVWHGHGYWSCKILNVHGRITFDDPSGEPPDF
jgi:hypothetical protein